LGIRSMQERLRSFGGTLHLRSGAAGTTIRAELPRVADSNLAYQQTA